MPTVSSSAVVRASADEIFDFIADYRNIPRLQPQFNSATLIGELERCAGANVDLRGHFHGVPIHVHNRIITYVPPRRMVSVTDGPLVSRSTWELVPRDGEPPTTHVTLTLDYKLGEAMGGLFRGMGSALWPIFNRDIQGMTNESLKRLSSFFGSG